MPRALITGITGQDGSYLTELLLEKGYEVHGVVRRTSSLERSRLEHLYHNNSVYNKSLFLHYADLEDPTTLRRVVMKVAPDELYHLAGQSHVGLSFDIPESTCALTAMGTLRLLEIIRDMPRTPRVYHASTSEIFGKPDRSPQDEKTPYLPVTPYGCAKAFATRMVTIYRDSFKIYACNGIMYNHESPRRGENFVTRKICRAAAAIKLGMEKELWLGDLSTKRDWGHSRDYVRGMWLTLQQPNGDDYVFGTGVAHTVQNVVECAFRVVDLDWRMFVKQDPRLMRVAEPVNLVANPAKAKQVLGWQAETSFEEMIAEITRADLNRLSPP